MSLPIIVTHPSPLLHKGLRQLLVKSRFRPVRVATRLTQDLETYLVSLEGAIWLTGIERSLAATNLLLRKILSANNRVKVVIMAGSEKPEDMVAVLKAGACGYVHQDIGGETLLKALELIAHGELIVHPQLVLSETANRNGRAADNLDEGAAYLPTIGRPVPTLPSQPRLAFAGANLKESDDTSDVPSLSRREMLILRMLMEGASNKTIALKLVITESTVKVHMKAILRKLRLQNRTQAAIWARDHVDETTFTTIGVNGSSSVLTHHG
jgi:two-component system, NarL family, nitrate/nitrite response regulator NarL